MKLREALEPVIGELVADSMHTYLSELVVEDLLLRSEDATEMQRYLALESVVALMHRTDDRYTSLRGELAVLKRKYRRQLSRQRKQLLKQYK